MIKASSFQDSGYFFRQMYPAQLAPGFFSAMYGLSFKDSLGREVTPRFDPVVQNTPYSFPIYLEKPFPLVEVLSPSRCRASAGVKCISSLDEWMSSLTLNVQSAGGHPAVSFSFRLRAPPSPTLQACRSRADKHPCLRPRICARIHSRTGPQRPENSTQQSPPSPEGTAPWPQRRR